MERLVGELLLNLFICFSAHIATNVPAQPMTLILEQHNQSAGVNLIALSLQPGANRQFFSQPIGGLPWVDAFVSSST
ncbi:hypothetical protein [Gloeocapsa sp. PCC 7428]|uniref:hypothetical protein n=1 Tax=Gloeocapsa sp. PCC 7428 TaxID=1173026 RepID=UPI0005A4F1AB|nr:hypothetical protein [Gloeocapsa sp. PCC 7428]